MSFTVTTNTHPSLQTAWEKARLDDFFPNQFHQTDLQLEKICDFRIKRLFWFYKKLIVYVIDDRASIGKWRRVRKLESTPSTLAQQKRIREVVEMLQVQKEKFDSLGHREKSWFFQY